jgi:hypothetical protein
MAKITKSLYIESKDHLYKLADQHDNLSENKMFIPFMDSMRDHYYGCRCDAEKYNDLSNNEYFKLDNSEVLDFLKSYFECDIVAFIK